MVDKLAARSCGGQEDEQAHAGGPLATRDGKAEVELRFSRLGQPQPVHMNSPRALPSAPCHRGGVTARIRGWVAALVAFLLRHSSSLSIVAFLRHSLVDNAIAEWPIMRACHAGRIVAIERQAVVVEVAQRRRAPQPARTPPALPLERRQCLGPASRSPRVV